MEKLIEERKKLCNLCFFCKVMDYTYSWIYRAEHNQVKVSQRFWEDYAEAIKKIKKIIKKC